MKKFKSLITALILTSFVSLHAAELFHSHENVSNQTECVVCKVAQQTVFSGIDKAADARPISFESSSLSQKPFISSASNFFSSSSARAPPSL